MSITVTFTEKRLIGIWYDMIKRCHNEKNEAYKSYGGRGIFVCDRWRKNYSAFAYWSLKNGYKDNLTIDRINNNNSYNPRNCRFVTIQQQQKNRSNNLTIRIGNKIRILSDWSRETGIPVETIRNRYHRGIRGKKLITKGRVYVSK